MKVSAIRQLTGSQSSRIAAGCFAGMVQIWDARLVDCLMGFQSVLEMGGARLALSPDGTRVVTAGWMQGKRGGVACYDSETAARIWHRTDIGRTETVRFGASGEGVYCSSEEGHTLQLATANGATIETIAGTDDVRESEDGKVLFLNRRKHGYVVEGPQVFVISQLGLGLRDVAFGPRHVCVSEAGGDVRCFDIASGKARWRVSPREGRHFVRLHYREATDSFYGVEWEAQQSGARRLVLLRNGAREDICVLRSAEETFWPGGDALVTAAGEVINLEDGAVRARLSFPETDQPGRVVR